MTVAGKLKWVPLIKGFWGGFCAAMLFLGWGACLADERCANLDSLVLPFMITFSFPAGLFAALIISPWVEHATPLGFTLLWLGISIAGYAQWSMILANVGRPQVLTLGLNEPAAEVASAHKSAQQPSLQKKKKWNRVRQIQAFDRQGLTPLQRALKQKRL
jgi:hypothetical protein